MDIKILGGGCTKCDLLYKHTQEALLELNIVANVKRIHDYDVIASYGIMSTPALMVDEKILSTGRVLTAKKVQELLENIPMEVKIRA